jgi:16S rRNA (cytosine967-C5)-methyltransferase
MGAELITTGARICYSTCSILKAENEDMIKQFLFANPDFELQQQELVLPVAQFRQSFDHDGGYYAIITKKQPPNPQFS